MQTQELIQACLEINDPAGQQRFFSEQALHLDKSGLDELAQGLKNQADQFMRTDIKRCLQTAGLIDDLASLTGDPLHRALGLLAVANANTVVLGDYRKAVEYYDQAAALYAEQGRLVLQAQSQIGKIYALASLGNYDQALAAGEWARGILRQNGEWFHLARLKVNMAVIHARLGQYPRALDLFDLAQEAYRQLGIQGEPHWLRVELNRANVLRNLGRFHESIQASQTAFEMHHRLGQEVAASRAQQTLAITYFVLGRYNEALAILDEVREILLKDERQRQAMLVELFISDCLLQLRRFNDVLEKCRQVRALFSQLGTNFEVAQAILNEASAYLGLERYADAINSLDEARQLFVQEGNLPAIAETDLQRAAVSILQGCPEEGLALARECAAVFRSHDLPVWQARAGLVAARAALALNKIETSQTLISQALSIGERLNLPDLNYPCRHLLGQLALKKGRPEEGLAAFEQAIQDLELLCGRLMIEFRANFVEDKERIYEHAVAVCLDLGQPPRALEFAERAKSRALLDLLAHRLDLSITARSEADRPLVEELTRLRGERNQLYRFLAGGEGFGQRGETSAFQDDRRISEQKVLVLEKRITDLWHKLLIRNADYAREASLWQVRSEPVQPYLSPETLLLEYFWLHDQVVVFLVSKNDLQALRLPVERTQVQRLLQLLWLNLRAVPRSSTNHVESLAENAQGILHRLYQQLVEPVENHLEGYPRCVVVPHGPLHYLPFHALTNGQRPLLEQHEISYLPGASFLRYCSEMKPAGHGLAAIGHSYQGKLPFAVEEASLIASRWQGVATLEAQATLERIHQLAGQSRVLHLAAHGDFRPDNPLFSGLALADGWLTTLEIFNLRMSASLVTLSACQTGRSVIGGGDELLGLMRAFLAAGAASLVSTLWAVEDRSTAQLMQTFYAQLAQGETKAAALRQAQLDLLRDQSTGIRYSHPYFWAPFYLVGDTGHL